MKRLLIFWLGLALGGVVPNFAQDAEGPAVQQSEIYLLNEAQLEELLGPIALYPDPLLAAVLTAATQPAEVVMAARFVERGGDMESAEILEWSESLQAVARYPELLLWMEENLEWTTGVGRAFLEQPEDVMDAVQRLRARAEALGNLVTTELERVESEDGVIDILPVDPDWFYLPQYDPAVVFTRPATAVIGPLVTFGGGKRTGAWLRHDWDWTNRRIVVWQKQSARPRGWWGQTRTVRFQNVKGGHAAEWCPKAVKGQAQGKWWGQQRARIAATGNVNAVGQRGSPTPVTASGARTAGGGRKKN